MAIQEGYLIQEIGEELKEPIQYNGQVDFFDQVGLMSIIKPNSKCRIFLQGSKKDWRREAVVLFAEKDVDFKNIKRFEQTLKLPLKKTPKPLRIKNIRIFALYKNEPA